MNARVALLLMALVVPAAFVARTAFHRPLGAALAPEPDSVEYAAGAQSIAAEGRYFLQVGPHRLRPRYPPGWPALLALAVRAGVRGDDLWRVNAGLGSLLAGLVALVAAAGAARLADDGRGSRATRAALVAGLVAGLAWAFAANPSFLGQTLLCDETTTLLVFLALGLAVAATRVRRGRVVFGLASGVALGVAASMRPIAAALAAIAFALLAAAVVRRAGVRTAIVPALACGAGALAIAGGVALLLVRSGLPPWPWSAYDFWTPHRFAPGGDAFAWRYVLAPDDVFAVGAAHPSHLGFALRVLLGLPGVWPHESFGWGWPLAGWAAAVPLARRARAAGGDLAAAVPWLAAALALWTLAHLAVFAAYFYPAARFLQGPAAAATILLGVAVGLAAVAGDSRRRAVAAAACLAIALSSIAAWRGTRDVRPGVQDGSAVLAAEVARWAGWRDARRARRAIPFDPVRAQAYGLLPRERLARIRHWGLLPLSIRTLQLELAGVLGPDELPPHAMLRNAAAEAGLRRLRWPPPIVVAGGTPPGRTFLDPPFRGFAEPSP